MSFEIWGRRQSTWPHWLRWRHVSWLNIYSWGKRLYEYTKSRKWCQSNSWFMNSTILELDECSCESAQSIDGMVSSYYEKFEDSSQEPSEYIRKIRTDLSEILVAEQSTLTYCLKECCSWKRFKGLCTFLPLESSDSSCASSYRPSTAFFACFDLNMEATVSIWRYCTALLKMENEEKNRAEKYRDMANLQAFFLHEARRVEVIDKIVLHFIAEDVCIVLSIIAPPFHLRTKTYLICVILTSPHTVMEVHFPCRDLKEQ